MKLTPVKEIISVFVVVILGLVLLNPFHFLMSSMLEMTLYSVLLVVTAVFAGLVANEKVQDEREEKNRATAGRIGYLSGLLLIVVGIFVQTFTHQTVDPWLTTTLVVMVVGKVFSRLYTHTFE